jgi:hypothetical protein
VLVIECPVSDAAVWIDDRYVAEVREAGRGFALAPGLHRVEVRHDAYHAYFGEVTLGAGATQTVHVELAERLP